MGAIEKIYQEEQKWKGIIYRRVKDSSVVDDMFQDCAIEYMESGTSFNKIVEDKIKYFYNRSYCLLKGVSVISFNDGHEKSIFDYISEDDRRDVGIDLPEHSECNLQDAFGFALNAAIGGSEEDSYRFFTAKRWGYKVLCPFCMCENQWNCKSHSNGVIEEYRCTDCLKFYSIRTNTVFAYSNIELWKWLYLINCIQKNIMPSQRKLGETIGLSP